MKHKIFSDCIKTYSFVDNYSVHLQCSVNEILENSLRNHLEIKLEKN